ncbi:MAG: hypothetical protein Q7K57_48635 [Burkholderiaceae bacterium]|nr:hypothetical protein [Burkholderiaceae bacterium]
MFQITRLVPSTVGNLQLLRGVIMELDDLRQNRWLVTGVPNIPFATADCELEAASLKNVPWRLGCGYIPCGDIEILTIRFQLGSTQVMLLANPADPEVHRLMNLWDREKTMGCVAVTHEECAAVMHAEFALTPPMRALMEQWKNKENDLEEFRCALACVFSSGLLQLTGESDIPEIPHLTSVRVGLLATEHTTPGPEFVSKF